MFDKKPAQLECLVVGATPGGLAAALFLARAGIAVQIVDQRTGVDSLPRPVVLTPSAVSVLDDAGVLSDLLPMARKLDQLTIHCNGQRDHLSIEHGRSPFSFWLSVDEGLIQQALLRELASLGLTCDWEHRLKSLEPVPVGYKATLERLTSVGQGYAVQGTAQVVAHTDTLIAHTVIGADGPNSRVRGSLGSSFETTGGRRTWAVFDVRGDHPLGSAHAMVSQASVDLLWPLAGDWCRWMCQLNDDSERSQLRFQNDMALWLEPLRVGEAPEALLHETLAERATWLDQGLVEGQDGIALEYEPRSADLTGLQRIGLLGEALELSGPRDLDGASAGLIRATPLANAVLAQLRGEHDAMALHNRQLMQERQQTSRRLELDTSIDGLRLEQLDRELPLDRSPLRLSHAR